MRSTTTRTSIAPILWVNFVGTLGFSIVLPFLIYLVTRFGGNAIVYGLMGATYSAFQLIGAPILGRWSDRFGRKRILLLSHLGTLAAWGVFLVALTLPVASLAEVRSGPLGAFTLTVPLVVLFVARALDGLTGGNVSVAQAYLADITVPSLRSENFGKMAVASNIGFVLGPAIAGVLGATGMAETLPVLAAIAVSIVAAFSIAFGLREPPARPIVRDPQPVTVRRVLGPDQKECYAIDCARLSTRQILRLPRVARLLTLYLLVFLAFNIFYVALPVHAVAGLTWSLGEMGLFFSVLGIMMAVVQGPVLGWASRRWTERTLVVIGGLLLATGFGALVVVDSVAVYAGAAFVAVGNGILWPSLLALLSMAAGDETQGAVQGFASSAGAIASIVGLLAGGFLYGSIGAAVFLVAAGVTITVVWIATRLPRHPAA